ncbi:septum formation family protein [Microbacterium sp. I2]|jgi:hypothetical protein|uniref:septum formation family protein n=1 Tax=Microbacterium sp. I2 TaxID=3391826 RepID=UPI003ED86C8A
MTHNRARLALAGLVLATAAALSGCSLVDQLVPASEPVRDAQTDEVTEANDNADVFAIQVGDCLATADMGSVDEVTSIPVVPCADPHDDEVYYAYDLAEGEYPGEEAVKADADATCIPEFANFIGLAYEESVLDYWPLYPTEGSWASGDREVLCIAWDPSGAKLTGTLAGAAR